MQTIIGMQQQWKRQTYLILLMMLSVAFVAQVEAGFLDRVLNKDQSGLQTKVNKKSVALAKELESLDDKLNNQRSSRSGPGADRIKKLLDNIEEHNRDELRRISGNDGQSEDPIEQEQHTLQADKSRPAELPASRANRFGNNMSVANRRQVKLDAPLEAPALMDQRANERREQRKRERELRRGGRQNGKILEQSQDASQAVSPAVVVPIKQYPPSLPPQATSHPGPAMRPTPAINHDEEFDPVFDSHDEFDGRVRPVIKPPVLDRTHKDKKKGSSKYFSADFYKKKAALAYKGTVKVVQNTVNDLPKVAKEANDKALAVLKWNDNGNVLALIEDVKQDIHFVKSQFSYFTITWSPIMEASLNYVGRDGLDSMRDLGKEPFDFRLDALHALTYGYEFAHMMANWRDNILIAHYAYKNYLETLRKDLPKLKTENPDFRVDEEYIEYLHSIRYFMLLLSWMAVDKLNLEPVMKLDHMSSVHENREKEYERDYLRKIEIFDELYKKTITEINEQKKQVYDLLGHTKDYASQLEDIETYYEEFREALYDGKMPDLDCRVPDFFMKFMEDLRPELRYNPIVYNELFLLQLKNAKEQAIKEYKL